MEYDFRVMKLFISWAIVAGKGDRQLIDAFDAGLSQQIPDSLKNAYDEFLRGTASPEQKLFAALQAQNVKKR